MVTSVLAEPPEGRAKVVSDKVALSPFENTDRVTLPPKPMRLLRCSVEVPVWPGFKAKELGRA